MICCPLGSKNPCPILQTALSSSRAEKQISPLFSQCQSCRSNKNWLFTQAVFAVAARQHIVQHGWCWFIACLDVRVINSTTCTRQSAQPLLFLWSAGPRLILKLSSSKYPALKPISWSSEINGINRGSPHVIQSRERWETDQWCPNKWSWFSMMPSAA